MQNLATAEEEILLAINTEYTTFKWMHMNSYSILA